MLVAPERRVEDSRRSRLDCGLWWRDRAAVGLRLVDAVVVPPGGLLGRPLTGEAFEAAYLL